MHKGGMVSILGVQVVGKATKWAVFGVPEWDGGGDGHPFGQADAPP